MAEQQETIFIDVQFKTEEVSKQLADVTQNIALMKTRAKELESAIKAGNDTTGKMALELAQLQKEIKGATAEQKALTGQLQQATTANDKLGTSFREMDAQLRQLENQYKSLSREQRNTAEGQALKQAIIEQKQALKEFDAELGNHQRNVGNYPKVVTSIIPGFDQLNGVLGSLGVSMESMAANGANAFAGLGASVKSFGKLFLTPPIAIIAVVLGGIMYAVNKLQEAFKKNDDASTKMQAAMAKLKPIGDVINKMFIALADVVANLVDKIASAYEWIIKLGNRLGVVSDEFVEATVSASNLVRSIDELQEMERQYTKNSAYRSKEVAKLRYEAQNTEDLDVRIEKLKEAIKLEEADLKERQAIAAKRLANLKADQKATGDTSDETKDKIAEATAALYQAEEQFYTGVRRLNKELAKAVNERDAEIAILGEAWESLFGNMQKQWQEIVKPAEVYDPEEDEVIIALTYRQQKIADLMKQGKSYADAVKLYNLEITASYAESSSKIAASVGATFEALSNLVADYAEENETAAKAAKGFALVGIIASEAEAIANGVKATTAAIAGAMNAAAATGVAAPFTAPAFIAEMTAIVASVLASTLSNIAQAKNVLSGAKFATGGVVTGTSYTGDRVPIMVNSGEMVLNKEQQTRLFEIANSGANGVQYELLTSAMTQALQNMPAPVMVYSEFQKFGQQVATYKEITAI